MGAGIALAATVIGSAVSAYGAMQQASAASAAANYNAQVASQNQQIAQQNASRAALAGEQQAAVSEQKTRAEAGAIRAQQAAGGVDVNVGSAVDVQSSAASLGELNAITIRSNAAREAYGYQTQATGYGNQAQLDTSQAASAAAAGPISAASTFLGGVGGGISEYQRYQLQAAGPLVAGGNAP